MDSPMRYVTNAVLHPLPRRSGNEMAAKVIEQRGAWWVRTHHAGKKRETSIGALGREAIEKHLEEIVRVPLDELVEQRFQKYRNMGNVEEAAVSEG